MNARRILPYLLGLVVLAFALGSLSRGSSGGSLLFQSYWLLYVIYLGPVAILATMIALIVVIGLNWRDLGSGIGFGIARKGRERKRRPLYSILVYVIFWAVAIGILLVKKGSIFNPQTNSTQIVKEIVGPNPTPPMPLLAGGLLPAASSLVDNGWFSVALLGLLAICSMVLVQSVRVAMREMKETSVRDLHSNQIEGLEAVQGAIMLVNEERRDPRSRIIACYQHMLTTVSRLGAPVSSDQTARELESAIRSTFALTGPAPSDLTKLFEEARYSLHEVDDDDATNARTYLESIAEELKIQLSN